MFPPTLQLRACWHVLNGSQQKQMESTIQVKVEYGYEKWLSSTFSNRTEYSIL